MLIDRERECEFLKRKILSNKAELLITYGRRRVGKSFLQRHSQKAHSFQGIVTNSY
ncbi:MAG: hypothetical protein WHT65_08560 [Pseudothermotoga sp.]